MILLLMVAAYVSAQRQVLDDEELNRSESECLGNGHIVSAGYGTTKANDPVEIEPKAKDAQLSTWLDYFIGFRVLFPYIWLVTSLPLTLCSLTLMAGPPTPGSSR